MNDMHTPFDLETATMEDLENISLEDLLGQDMADISLTSSLPDGTFLGYIEKYEKKMFAAKPEQDKKASIALNVTIAVHSAQHLADPNGDPEAVVGRKHFQAFFITNEMGQAQLVKLLLGIIGVKFSDKDAIKQVGQSPIALLEELKANRVYFGFTIKNSERGGYENSDIVFKQEKFITMDDAAAMMV